MKTLLQVLFGLVLGAISLVAVLYLGLLLHDGSPDWRTAVVCLLVIGVTQWVALWAFRHRVAVQVFVGVGLCLAIAFGLVFSTVPMFWEHEEAAQHAVYTITWRSDVVFLLLLAVGQGISFLVFRWLKAGKQRNSGHKGGAPTSTTD